MSRGIKIGGLLAVLTTLFIVFRKHIAEFLNRHKFAKIEQDIKGLNKGTKPSLDKDKTNFWATVRHFKPSEFNSRTKDRVKIPNSGFIGMKEHAVRLFDESRHIAGFPIIIGSGFRTKEHNESIVDNSGNQYSAKNSPHMLGIAADLQTNSFTDTVMLLKSIFSARTALGGDYPMGIGVYGSKSRPGGFFIHLDTREHKSYKKDTLWISNDISKSYMYRNLTSSQYSMIKTIFNQRKR